jgi:hypothetical protein
MDREILEILIREFRSGPMDGPRREFRFCEVVAEANKNHAFCSPLGARGMEPDAPRIKKSADKPGSVENNHSSGTCVATSLKRPTRMLVPLFGLAPSGVYRAVECYHRRGALLPHPFTLTGSSCDELRRFAFCCTFRGLTSPRRYLALCPWSPDFPLCLATQRLSSQLRAGGYATDSPLQMSAVI